MSMPGRPKIFVSNFPFAREDRTPFEMLTAQNFEVVVNPLGRKLKPEETAHLGHDCDAIIAGTENLGPLVQGAPNLKLVSRIGIGLDGVPLGLCRQKGIAVAWTPDAVTPAVSELTIGLMVTLTRSVVRADRELRAGGWTRPYGKRLEKSTIGIIGFGRVGYQVARLLGAFKPEKILVNDIKDVSDRVDFLRSAFPATTLLHTDKETIFRESDIVTLHVPLTRKTRELVNAESLALMRPDSWLINTARGELVDEDALYDALTNGRLSGAAIDVFRSEPYSGKLTGLDSVILTQHMGSCAYDCRVDMETQAAESVVRFFTGDAVTRLVPDSEYQYQ